MDLPIPPVKLTAFHSRPSPRIIGGHRHHLHKMSSWDTSSPCAILRVGPAYLPERLADICPWNPDFK